MRNKGITLVLGCVLLISVVWAQLPESAGSGGTGGTAAPVDAKYIVQQADATLTAEQAMGALATGLVKNAATTGVQSIAVGDTDYTLPATLNSHTGDTTAHGATGAVVGTTNTQSLDNKTIIDYDNHVHANATHTRVRNDTADNLAKGTPVYITGYNVGLNVATVGAAKADSAITLPAIGLLEADIAKNATGESLGTGVLLNVKTDYAGWAVGDKLWVSTATAGTLTKTRPTGSTNLVQRMGIVLRRHASLGIIKVIGAHRSNSLPLDIDAGLILSGTLPLARLDTPVGYWRSYTVAYTDSAFEVADTNALVTLFTLPADGVIEALRIKHSVPYAGTAVSSVACSVGDSAGDTADDDAYIAAFDVFQAAGDTVAEYDGSAFSTTAAQQTVQLHCVCNVNFGDGSGTTVLTAGSVDIHVKWAVLP